MQKLAEQKERLGPEVKHEGAEYQVIPESPAPTQDITTEEVVKEEVKKEVSDIKNNKTYNAPLFDKKTAVAPVEEKTTEDPVETAVRQDVGKSDETHEEKLDPQAVHDPPEAVISHTKPHPPEAVDPQAAHGPLIVATPQPETKMKVWILICRHLAIDSAIWP